MALEADKERWVGPQGSEIHDEWLERLAAHPYAKRIERLRLNDVAFRYLVRLESLRALDLNGMESPAARIAHLRGLPGLTELRIEISRPCEAALDRLALLSGLRDPELGCPALRSDEVANVAKLTGLRRLRLCAEKGGKPLEALAPVEQLEALDLSFSETRDRDLSALSRFPKLRCLVLQRTAIRGEGLRFLQAQPALEELDVTFCAGLDDRALKEIAGLEHLRRLDAADAVINWCGTTGVTFGP